MHASPPSVVPPLVSSRTDAAGLPRTSSPPPLSPKGPTLVRPPPASTSSNEVGSRVASLAAQFSRAQSPPPPPVTSMRTSGNLHSSRVDRERGGALTKTLSSPDTRHVVHPSKELTRPPPRPLPSRPSPSAEASKGGELKVSKGSIARYSPSKLDRPAKEDSFDTTSPRPSGSSVISPERTVSTDSVSGRVLADKSMPRIFSRGSDVVTRDRVKSYARSTSTIEGKSIVAGDRIRATPPHDQEPRPKESNSKGEDRSPGSHPLRTSHRDMRDIKSPRERDEKGRPVPSGSGSGVSRPLYSNAIERPLSPPRATSRTTPQLKRSLSVPSQGKILSKEKEKEREREKEEREKTKRKEEKEREKKERKREKKEKKKEKKEREKKEKKEKKHKRQLQLQQQPPAPPVVTISRSPSMNSITPMRLSPRSPPLTPSSVTPLPISPKASPHDRPGVRITELNKDSPPSSSLTASKLRSPRRRDSNNRAVLSPRSSRIVRVDKDVTHGSPSSSTVDLSDMGVALTRSERPSRRSVSGAIYTVNPRSLDSSMKKETTYG